MTDNRLLSHRKALTNQVRRIAQEAGELILEYFDGVRDHKTTQKCDGSPVTCADQEAEALIEKALMQIDPTIPFIGEEKYESGNRPDTSGAEYFWLVDALDGTRAFIRGEGEFTVNIALIHKGHPVLGVVYAPEKGQLFSGYTQENGESEAIKVNEDTNTEKSMRTRRMTSNGLTVLLGSLRGDDEKEVKHLLSQYKIASIKKHASSLKLTQIASGKADLYPRFGPISEWDIAAGHAVLKAAGGNIIDIQKNAPLTYTGTRKDMCLPHFIAGSGDFLAMHETNFFLRQ